jgi:hypothetical protein
MQAVSITFRWWMSTAKTAEGQVSKITQRNTRRTPSPSYLAKVAACSAVATLKGARAGQLGRALVKEEGRKGAEVELQVRPKPSP